MIVQQYRKIQLLGYRLGQNKSDESLKEELLVIFAIVKNSQYYIQSLPSWNSYILKYL